MESCSPNKSNFQYSREEYAKHDRIDWEDIYKSMLKDRQLSKILKKNHYYVLNKIEKNQASEILETLPFKDDIKVQFFTDHYQNNLEKFLKGDLNKDQLMHNLNFPRMATFKESPAIKLNSSILPPKIKRLNIKDIKKVLDRLSMISNERKSKESSTNLNNSQSTTDIAHSNSNSHRMTLRMVDSAKKPPINGLEPEKLKYSIIKNMILEKFREREQRKLMKGTKYTPIKSKSQDNKLPKLLQSMQAIEEEMLEKIENKNLSSVNPRHHSFYLRFRRKLSDGVLKSERKPLIYDSKEKGFKKMKEDNQARNIQDSNLKYHINRSADGYIEALKHFKDLSRSFNKNIVLKEGSRMTGKRMSLGNIDQGSKHQTPRIGLWDYLHHSNLIDQHKAGLISNIGIADMMMDRNKEKDSGVELKVVCERDLRDMARVDKIYEKTKAVRDGEFSRLANNMLQTNEIEMKPLKRCLKRSATKSPKNTKNEEKTNLDRSYDEGNDSLQSINENKLDLLYNESIALQKKMKIKGRNNFSDKIKRLIKLEELNKKIIAVNQKKLEGL